jgi:hypothetical protein
MKRLFNFVKFEGLNDCLDFFHFVPMACEMARELPPPSPAAQQVRGREELAGLVPAWYFKMSYYFQRDI